MISNTDSIHFIYFTEHMRVKVYYRRAAQATVAEVGFDSVRVLEGRWPQYWDDSHDGQRTRSSPSRSRSLLSRRAKSVVFRRAQRCVSLTEYVMPEYCISSHVCAPQRTATFGSGFQGLAVELS